MAAQEIKIVLIGSTSVGKTTLADKWELDKSNPNQMPTVGVAVKHLEVEYEEKPYKLSLWDTAGQEQFRSITVQYFRGTNSAILVYDITQRSSFDDLPGWISTLQQNETVPFIIVGNKCDLQERAVSFQEASDFAKTYDAPYFETSAVTGMCVEEAFAQAIACAVVPPAQQSQSQSNANAAPATPPPSNVDITNGGNKTTSSNNCSC